MLADFLEGVTVWAPIVMKQGLNTPGPTSPSPPTAPSYRLYVDGDLVDTAPAPQATGNNLTIGGADVFSDCFEGPIDQLQIYDRALDAGEVGGD